MSESPDPERDLKESVNYQERNESSSPERPLKLDPHGFPLRPQPSDDSRGESFIAKNVTYVGVDRMTSQIP